LHGGKPGNVLWLAPTWRAAADVRNRIPGAELQACWEPGVFTFDKFAQAILESFPEPMRHKGTVSFSPTMLPAWCPENQDNPPRSIRPLSSSVKRQLVRHLIGEQLARGRIGHFLPIVSSSGLVDLVCELISELKRLEIWPEDLRRACQARGFTAKDRELLELYEAYQLILRENQLYDAEGRLWSARDWLQQGHRRPFENLRLAVADGFTDFTRTQHEILELLAGWVDEIIISLPLESEPCRNDLFGKPLKTLKELKRRHSNLSVIELPRPENPPWPAIIHLEKNLFINPRTCATGSASATHAPNTEGIEILSAAKPQGEMELVGARIKRLLAEGIARPGEIAVVFRSPQDDGGLAAEVFNRLGIPAAWEMGQKLDRIPVMQALKSILQLDLDDWPFRGLLGVLGNNYFQPDWCEWQAGKSAAIVEKTIRNLQIPHGRKQLLDQLTAVSEDNPALSILNRLAGAFDELPVKAALPQWAKAWEKLAREIGLLRDTDSDDKNAWNRLMTALSAGEQIARWLHRRAEELDRKEAFQVLLDILASERMLVVDDESGRVRVLSAASVRSLQVPYLFLAGLSEKAFPPPDREERLYSEAEYLELIEKGLPLVARTERAREEMLLFYEALTRATRRLYLSYPSLDEAAQPLSPSPYLIEVIQACGGREIVRAPAADLRPIPAGDEPLSAAQFRVKAVADALAPSGDISLFAGLLQSKIANLPAGLETIILRQDRKDFGPAEGVFLGKPAQKLLAKEFPSKRCFTASELEQYASCPYRFLLQNILKLEPLEDITMQLDALERGRIVHEALALFHRRVNESFGRPASPLELAQDEFDRMLENALQDSLPAQSNNPVRAALGEINRRLIAKWLAEYRKQCESYDKLWSEYDEPLVPEFFETSFGESKHREADAIAIDEPLEFADGKQSIRVSGRIDRIDAGKIAGINIFNILDYKTGKSLKFSDDEAKRGTALQLPLYALAAAKLILNDRDCRPWRAGYWNVAKDGFKPKQSLVMFEQCDDVVMPSENWETIRMDVEKIIPSLVQNIRRGRFPVFNLDQHCTSYCPLSTLCRIRQIRSLEKTWLPTQ
jgi:ATP-dependent helicase/DNAse subunit B